MQRNPPQGCKILGSVVKEQLRKINPARMRYTEFKPPQGGFIFKEKTMEKKKVIVYVDGYNFIMVLDTEVVSGSAIIGSTL